MPPARAAAAARRERVAIVGAGAGGVAAAYFLAGTHDVELFEARGRIGGHCDSRTVEHRGHRVTVDLGAQFFHPDTHPIYVTLLEEIGLYDPEHPEADETLESPGSLCVFPVGGGPPVFSSANPLATLPQALDFATFTQLARAGGAHRSAVGDQRGRVDPQPALGAALQGRGPRSVDHGDDRLVPSGRDALVGARDPADVRARLPRGPRPPRHHVHLAHRPPGQPAAAARPQPGGGGAPARARPGLERKRGRWFVCTPHGRRGPFGHVVLNAPPRVGRKLLRPLPAFAEATALLGAYRYFDSRLLIHTDPAYVHADRANWAAYNAGVDGRECEGSAWLGALHEPLPTGGTVDVFKSWATRRDADPSAILLERRFEHPLIGRGSLRAARRLRRLQGRDGLHFSGQYTTGMDLQESAVYSAMQVARALAPRSATLAALDARLAARGRDGISYDL